MWLMPSRCASTGTRASAWTRATSPLPPRGTIKSIAPVPDAPSAASIAPTAARSVVGTNCAASAGMPLATRPDTSAAWIARLLSIASEPPRRMTALPAITASAAASAVTFGRLS
ncbi:hypothetical protein D9M73_133590 [compost metagenome]